jgi:1-acyl-sn-glycerol-3-phosphate acyltransferase
MRYVFSLLYCVYFFITAALLFLVLCAIYPIVVLFDRRKKVLHYLTLLWGFHFVKLNPFWNCRFEGIDNLASGQNYVIVANHQSLADVFVLSGLKHHFRWVAKDSLMRVPFFGWIMRLNGDVAIKRGDIKSIKEMMSECKTWLSNNVSLLMFPEGTRSEDGNIREFRDGPFRLAVDCNVPVVPVIITGTRDVMSKSSRVFNFGAAMTVRILPPVPPQSFEGSSGKMRRFVHELMTDSLADLRNLTAQNLSA